MGGSKKGKNKKNKKEKSNPQKSDERKTQTGKSSDVKSQLEYKKEERKTSEAKKFSVEELRKQLYLRIEEAFKEALSILLDLGYSTETAKTALLTTGFIVGGGQDMLTSLMKSALTLINSHPHKDGKVIFDKKPIFDDLQEMIKLWIQIFENLVETKWSDLPKSQAFMHMLSSRSLLVANTPRRLEEAASSSSFGEFLDKRFDFDTLLSKNIASMKTMKLTKGREVAKRHSEMTADASVVSPPQEHHHHHHQTSAPHNSLFDESLLDCFDGRYDEKSVKEWLENCSNEEKDKMYLSLEALQKQVDEVKEWAEQRVKEASSRLESDTRELKELRILKEELKQIEREKEELGNSGSMEILKKDLEGRDKMRQLGLLKATITILESENGGLRPAIGVVNLAVSEAKRKMKQEKKKEKEKLKKIENSEKQISMAQGQIHEEKVRILELEREFKEIEEAQKEAKLRFQQEKEDREQARFLLSDERKLSRIANENSNKKLASLERDLDMQYQRVMDDKVRLVRELSLLEVSSPAPASSPGVWDWEASTSKLPPQLGEETVIPEHRRCMVCLQKEVSVLFIPCAHQVVCLDCNNSSVGEFCPCCHVLIAKAYRVYAGGSA